MQLSPFETHFDQIPIISIEQDALVVPKISENYFNLQAVDVLVGFFAIAAVVIVYKNQGPSVTRTQAAERIYK